jgi:hypothetical protein
MLMYIDSSDHERCANTDLELEIHVCAKLPDKTLHEGEISL